jgi:hypothetical protein
VKKSESDVEIFQTRSSFRIPSDESDNDINAILDGTLGTVNSHPNFELRASLLFVNLKKKSFCDISDFEGDDSSLIETSEEIENKASTKDRFSKLLQRRI